MEGGQGKADRAFSFAGYCENFAHRNGGEKTGGKGVRTPGLVIANDALYQLSYTPVSPWRLAVISEQTRRRQGNSRNRFVG